MSLKLPDYTAFKAAVHSEFMASLVEDAEVRFPPLEMVECSRKTDDYCDATSLIFEGSEEHPMGQMTYALAHPDLGEFPAFLVPLGPKNNRFQYQCIINRLIQA